MREERIWQSVLLLTIGDALYGPDVCSGQAQREQQIIQARAYLTTPSDDLTIVCTLAGFDPDLIIETLKTRIAQAPSVEAIIAAGRRATKPLLTPKDTKPKRIPFRSRPFTINCVTRTATEWSERTGISLATSKRRLDHGWDAERAFTMPVDEGQRLGRITMQQRCKAEAAQAKAKPAQATTLKPGFPAKVYEHEGEHLTLKEWGARYDLHPATIKARMKTGMALTQALTMPKAKGKLLTDRLKELAA